MRIRAPACKRSIHGVRVMYQIACRYTQLMISTRQGVGPFVGAGCGFRPGTHVEQNLTSNTGQKCCVQGGTEALIQ